MKVECVRACVRELTDRRGRDIQVVPTRALSLLLCFYRIAMPKSNSVKPKNKQSQKKDERQQRPALLPGTSATPFSDRPKGWPSSIQVTFLERASSPSPLLPQSQRTIYCSPPAQSSVYHPATARKQGYTIIHPIDETTPATHGPGTHPARGQCGLFANRE